MQQQSQLSRIDVLAAASAELMTPAKSTRNPTAIIATAATYGLREISVARVR